MDHQSDPDRTQSLVQSTQPFDKGNDKYQARLASALGNHNRSTQAFDTQDPVYKARLQAALGQSGHAYPDLDPDPAPKASQPTADAVVPADAQTQARAPALPSTQPAPQELPPVKGFLEAANKEGTRLLFLPSGPEFFELKHANVEGHQSLAGEWIDVLWEVDKDKSVETLRVIAVSQSTHNVACDVAIQTASKATVLAFQVYFDPSSNAVSLHNTASTSTILIVRGAQHDQACQQEIRIYKASAAQLSPGQ